MKKIISKFAGSLLSREDLKAIKGGEEYGGSGCGQCWSYVTEKIISCKSSPTGGCTCSGGGYQACG